jgi:hypothetical protein
MKSSFSHVGLVLGGLSLVMLDGGESAVEPRESLTRGRGKLRALLLGGRMAWLELVGVVTCCFSWLI